MPELLALWLTGRGRIRTGSPTARPEPKSASSRLVEGIESRIRELVEADFPEMWEALTENGRNEFVHEVAVAFASVASEDRDLAMADAIEGWYRTWLVRQDPGYETAMARAGKTAAELGERVYTIDELDEFMPS